MRVSSSQIAQNAQYGIMTSYSRFNDAQRKVSTGKQLQSPSDNPSGTAQVLSFRKRVADIDQFTRNMDQAKAFLSTSETALDSVSNLLRQARAIGVQGASDNVSVETRSALANQVQQIMTQVGNLGNTTHGGRFVFGGQRTLNPPMQGAGNTFAYVGGTAATGDADLNLDIGQGETMKINTTGDMVMAPILTALGSLRDHVAMADSQNVSRVDLAALDTQLNNLLGVRADMGSKIQRIDLTRARNETTKVGFTEFISNIEDADIPQSIVELQTAQTAYQASLQVTAQVFQTSLLNFLK